MSTYKTRRLNGGKRAAPRETKECHGRPSLSAVVVNKRGSGATRTHAATEASTRLLKATCGVHITTRTEAERTPLDVRHKADAQIPCLSAELQHFTFLQLDVHA